MATSHAVAASVEPTHAAAGDPLARVFAQYDLPVVRGEGVWLITSDGRRVLDNLNKGAAGGAVQWMNRLQGLPETAGLTAPAAGWT